MSENPEAQRRRRPPIDLMLRIAQLLLTAIRMIIE
jgi:hypothetical protein